tara:strand:- start:909 stop:1166 length:258 start_codon:yes stop_codon:yes gene_type:complete
VEVETVLLLQVVNLEVPVEVVKHQLLVEQEIHLLQTHLKEKLVEEVHQETVEKVVVEQLQLEEHPRQIMEAVELEVQVHQMQSQE